MDAFYASVEELDFPELKGKPVAVGGNKDRGVVAAANYEARKFGVKSAISSKLAARLCPELIFVKPRFERYKEISIEIRKIFERYTDIIEPLALDEAFLDVTENKIGSTSATFIAQAIKNDIKNELNLVGSAGVSYNKFLAKMASDQDKPDGLFIIKENEAQNFIENLTIHRFFGVGKVTADKMIELGIPTGKQLKNHSEEFLINHFGKAGTFFYHVARGIDNRAVQISRERKSIAVETTFNDDIREKVDFENKCEVIAKSLWKRYEKQKLPGKTLSLKIKYNNFSIRTKSLTLAHFIVNEKELLKTAKILVKEIFPLENPVRLLGFQISNFKKTEDEVSFIQTKLELE